MPFLGVALPIILGVAIGNLLTWQVNAVIASIGAFLTIWMFLVARNEHSLAGILPAGLAFISLIFTAANVVTVLVVNSGLYVPDLSWMLRA